jgi:hypothetical protein
MAVWEVYNGWEGNGLVRALVEADTQAEAEAAALGVFRDYAEKQIERMGERCRVHWERFVRVEQADQLDLPALLEE